MNPTPLLKTATGILITLATCATSPALAQAPAPVPPPPPPAKPAAATPGAVSLERWVASDNAFAVSYPKGWEPKQLPDNPAGGAGGAAVVSPLFTNTADAGEGKPDTFWVTTAGITTVNLPPPPSTPNRPSAPNRPAPRNDTPPPPPAPAPVRNFRAWAKAVREGVAQKVTDFKLVSENQGSLGGTVALRLIFDSKQDKGGDTVRMIQWICEKGDKAYVLTFMFDPKRMTKVIPIEQAVSRSFVFAPKDAPTDTHKVSGEPTPFEDKAHGFRLTYPPGWGSSPAKLPGVALALGKNASAGKVAQILMVIANPLEPNEKVTLKEMEALLDKLLPAAGLKDAKTAEATDIKLGGAAARRLVMTGTRQADDHAIRALGVVALNNRTAVIVIGAAPVEDFDAFQSDFDKVTESFAFLDAQAPAAAGATADATPVKPTPAAQAPTPAKPTAPPTATPPAATPPAANADPASNIDVPDAAMTLAAPAGWTVRKAPAPGIPLMLVSTPAKPGGRPSTITLATEPVPASGARPSPAQLADDAVKGFKATASDAKVNETTDPKVGGQRARQVVVAAHRNIGNIDLRVVIVCFYGGDKAVTLTGEAPAAEFDALKAAMDQVVTSATVKMGTPVLRRPQ